MTRELLKVAAFLSVCALIGGARLRPSIDGAAAFQSTRALIVCSRTGRARAVCGCARCGR